MTERVYTRGYTLPPPDRREVLRYAGGGELSDGTATLLDGVIADAKDIFTPKVCYTELPIKVTDAELDLGFAVTGSLALGALLSGCERIILLAATVGGAADRLMAKYSLNSPARALLLQALGAERIEATADAFSRDIACEMRERGLSLTKRFSPGYSDLPLDTQRDIFRVLDCQRRIGLTLNESLLMSPTKSIPAIIGLKNENN